MRIAPNVIQGLSVSEAWLRTLDMLNSAPDRKLFHVVTRIVEPTTEVRAIRTAVDDLLEDLHFRSNRTVANTIFPEALAATATDSHELAERYSVLYPKLKQLDKDNARGTYFLRMVSYPTANGRFDQVSDLIRKLQIEIKCGTGPKAARYELNIESPEDRAQHPSGDTFGQPHAYEGPATGSLGVYVAGTDTNPMSFPCLSFCSFQLDQGVLHMVAQYRSQYLIPRGYGNYLGLGQLLGYVCNAVHVTPGQLLVLGGYAQIDPAVGKARVNALISRCNNASD
jgi:hypothetical protein